jgi:hypothetical protein
VKKTKRHASLPIGRTARVAFEMDVMRTECCKTANAIMNHKTLDERELDDCARLDDALAQAQRILKATVRSIMLSRIGRKRRGSRAK